MLFHIAVLPLPGAELRPEVLQGLGVHEADGAGDFRHLQKLGVDGLEGILGVADGLHDVDDRAFQVIQGPLVLRDDLLPVPLVHIDGVEVVQNLLVPADGVHVGIDALAGEEAVAVECHALPLCQGLHHLGLCPGHGDFKLHRPLHAVEVVVQAGHLLHEEGGGDPVEAQGGGEVVLKEAMQQADGHLRVVDAENAPVALRYKNAHISSFKPLSAPTAAPETADNTARRIS